MTAFKVTKCLADIGRIVAVSCSAGVDHILTKRQEAPGAVMLRHVYRVISVMQVHDPECTSKIDLKKRLRSSANCLKWTPNLTDLRVLRACEIDASHWWRGVDYYSSDVYGHSGGTTELTQRSDQYLRLGKM